MSEVNLFDSADELREAMQRLEAGCDNTATALRTRIAAQERSLPELRKFGQGIDPRQYLAAREMVVAVAARSMNADRLEVLLLRLECEFVKRKARADRSRSNKRFDPFWDVFEALVKGHRCSSAEDAYELAIAQVPPPHAALSVARDRYRDLRVEMGLT